MVAVTGERSQYQPLASDLNASFQLHLLLHRKVFGSQVKKAMLAGTLNKSLIIFVALLCLVCSAFAQEPQPAKKAPRPNPANTPREPRPAPPVVTIVHRLNGLKMFRMLLRSEEQVEAIARLDDASNLTDEVHANIIAGLALDDGQTIAAWLPDAEAEFGPSIFAADPFDAVQVQASAPLRQQKLKNRRFPFNGGMFGSPDLTVIGPDGKRLDAEYVGLDGATGLSILRLSSGNVLNNAGMSADSVDEGQNVRLLNPEPAARRRPAANGSLYVRVGTTFGKVHSIKRAPDTVGVARVKVRSPRLSLANIGGIAVNDAGEAVGIVDAVEGTEATILPTAMIRRAATRVLSQHASVPRPWLGVKGEPVAHLSFDEFKNQGWKFERAASLLERQRGILLTSIAPSSPAAFALLRAGDVILQVNNKDVQNGDDFSWMLDEAGPSSSVTFTLARPNRTVDETVKVQLSGLFDPSMAFGFSSGSFVPPSLMSQGIETVALQPMVAAQLGATSGVLIVYVDPSSTAFEAGLRPGDVIESIDGQPLVATGSPVISTTGKPSRFNIVRKKQRLVVTLNPTDKKN
jgi:S1-C subfamily serine protease